MRQIPLQKVQNQTLTIALANQNCQLNLYQKDFFGLFMDVYVNNGLIVAGVICQNANRIVRDAYFGFIGDFIFTDMQGTSDPDYTGLGDRFQLIYLEASDLP